MSEPVPPYPFTAVVGADDVDELAPMPLALVLSTIAPEVGGVLVRGEKGTAKSTIVRALAAVLPPVDGSAVPLVELPIGATEDRVTGSINIESALAEGKAEYEPGLLARAHGGILYVDEVNLLHDHLVDLLLDAAATGRATVERDGVSVTHDARFVLVGTMNPEEGELRPQLLDRFGLTAEVAAPREPALRAEVVRRRMAYDAAPAAFCAARSGAEEALRSRMAAARELVGSVLLSDAALLKIAEVCAAFDVDGLRADLVTARAAVAHAAWCGRSSVVLDDIRVAASLALPHRRRRKPFDAPGLDEDVLDQVLGDDELPDDDPDPDPEGPEGPEGGPDGPPEGGPEDGPGHGDDTAAEQTGAADDEATTPPAPANRSGTSAVSATDPYRTRHLAVRGVGTGTAGRRSRARTSNGRRVGATRPTGTGGALHLVETLRAAVPHQHQRGRTTGRLLLEPADLRVAVREGRESNLVLFCVDASGSMAARKRMEQVKTAVLSLLLDAYQRRDKVGLVTFRAEGAEVALPPTGSVDAAAAQLDELPAGGRTPLAEGLLEAAHVLEVERTRDPHRRALLVVVTDGRATAGADAVRRSRDAAAQLAAAGVASVVVDCETGPLRMGLARELAAHLGAEHVPVDEVSAAALVAAAKGRAA
ncbi:MAG TPA: VWA domain-containing protein [Nocardioides sp.]|nr:VWA domain-containing protein [Nocardioides sp.]